MSVKIVEAFLKRWADTNDERIPVSAFPTDVPDGLRDIAKEVADISGGWNAVEIYTPAQDPLKQEQDRFFEAFDKGQVYNPRFTYPIAEKTDVQKARPRLEVLARQAMNMAPAEPAGKWFQKMLLQQLEDIDLTCDMVDGMCGRTFSRKTGDALTLEAFRRKYPGLDAELLRAAEADFNRRTRPRQVRTDIAPLLKPIQQTYLRERTFNAQQIGQAFGWALNQYGLIRTGEGDDGFAIVVTKDVTAIDVRHRSQNGPTVFVTKDRPTPMRGHELAALIGHEIEYHARQVTNGHRLFGICGGRLTVDDETLYEAPAVEIEDGWMEENFGPQEESRPFPYVYPTAVQAALQGSFHGVFVNQFNRYWKTEKDNPRGQGIIPRQSQVSKDQWDLAKDYAWRAAYRVKRGLRDTSRPGAMTKDLAYLRGQMIYRAMVENKVGHYIEAGLFGLNSLLLAAELDLKPEDLPLRDLRVRDTFRDQLLAELSS